MRIKGIGAILASSVMAVGPAVAMADETKSWRCRNDGDVYETILGQNGVNPGRMEQLTEIFNIELMRCEKLSLKVQKFFGLTTKPECPNPNQDVFNMYLPEGQVNPRLRLPIIIWPDEQVLEVDNRAAGLPLDCQPHGLRKAAGRRLAEAGCSSRELMAVLGHKTLSEAERYAMRIKHGLRAPPSRGWRRERSKGDKERL